MNHTIDDTYGDEVTGLQVSVSVLMHVLCLCSVNVSQVTYTPPNTWQAELACTKSQDDSGCAVPPYNGKSVRVGYVFS